MELRVNKNFIHSDYYQGVRNATVDIFAVIKEGQEQGRIRGDVSSYIIRNMVLGPLEHITTHWLIMGKKNKLTSFTKDISMLVISAISNNVQSDAHQNETLI